MCASPNIEPSSYTTAVIIPLINDIHLFAKNFFMLEGILGIMHILIGVIQVCKYLYSVHIRILEVKERSIVKMLCNVILLCKS